MVTGNFVVWLGDVVNEKGLFTVETKGRYEFQRVRSATGRHEDSSSRGATTLMYSLVVAKEVAMDTQKVPA